jgi:hypothetical protein
LASRNVTILLGVCQFRWTPPSCAVYNRLRDAAPGLEKVETSTAQRGRTGLRRPYRR